MGAAVFFFVFSLFAAVSAQDAETLALPGLPTLPDIHNSISDSMKKLMDDAQAATTLATTANSLAGALKTNADKRLKDAAARAAEVMEGVQQQLQTAVKKSGGDVNKLQACTQEQQTALAAFQDATLANMTGCVTERTSKAAGLEAKLLDASRTIFIILTEIGDQIQSRCPIPPTSTPESSAEHAFCTMNVIGYADGVVAKQFAIISANIAEYTALVDSLSTQQSDLTACFTTVATAATLASQPIIDKIVACTLA